MNSNRLTISLGIALCMCFVSPLWVVAGEGHNDVAAKDICANRRIPIVSMEVIRRLIHEVKERPESCPGDYLQSFYELEPILAVTRDEELCSEKKFNRIADYHFHYIVPKVETTTTANNATTNTTNHTETHQQVEQKELLGGNRKLLLAEKFDAATNHGDNHDDANNTTAHLIKIPIALQHFFKAWALQVSGLCKQALVDNLDRAIDNQLSQTDIEIIETLFKPQNQSSEFAPPSLDHQSRFDSLVYMPELEGAQEAGDIELRRQTKILDLRHQPNLDKFMHACKYRFEPIYSKLVMPIVRLSKLGYDYFGPQIDKISERLEKDLNILKWLSITSICEAQGKFELVENKEAPIRMARMEYEPRLDHYNIDEDLWIKGREALRAEFDRISGQRSKGFKRVVFRAGLAGRKVVAFLNPNQFAWYRKNQVTLGIGLTSMSILLNIATKIFG